MSAVNVIEFTRYDEATGRIVGSGQIQEEFMSVQMEMKPGAYLLGVLGENTHHYVDVDTWTLKNKTQLPVVQNGGVLSGLPSGTVARMDGVPPVTVNDGTLELTFETPGVYEVLLSHPKHYDRTVQLVAL